MNARTLLSEMYGDLVFMDGHDNAILGIVERFGQDPVVCYDFMTVLDNLMKEGLTSEAAVEWYEFNMLGAWVGAQTPAFLQRTEDF